MNNPPIEPRSANSRRESLVLIHIRLPIVANNADLISNYTCKEQLLNFNEQVAGSFDVPLAQHKGEFVKLGQGVYLADEDACYPAILRIIQLCGPRFPLLIVPVSDSALTLGSDHAGLREFLGRKNRSFRMTQSEPQAAPNKP